MKALKNKESFFCVDISSPATNIDKIATCVKRAPNFYIFSYRFKDRTKGDEKVLSLLHSKITYVKTSKNQFVFIGSHNYSKSAFNGINMEHSILIKFPLRPKLEEKSLLESFLLQLSRIKKYCTKFDLDLVQYYKGMQIIDGGYLPRIVLQLESVEWRNISSDQTVSIITFFDIIKDKSENQKNIKDKDLLVAIYNELGELKLFIGYGEADDLVEKGTMDSKVTDSDYIAVSFAGFSDKLGLPYLTFQSIPGSQVKGSAINFTNHLIQRIKLKEIISDHSLVREFTGIPKNINFYKKITSEDIEVLKKENFYFNQEDIEKIDDKKHNIEYLSHIKKESFKKAKQYETKINKIDSELEKSINASIINIYKSFLERSKAKGSENSAAQKSEILSALAKGLSLEDNPNDDLQKKILNKLMDLSKSKKNLLSQFEGKYHYDAPDRRFK